MPDPFVTIVIINYKTPDLLRRAAGSLRVYYPSHPLLLIDNGSNDGSLAVMEEFKRKSQDCTEILRNRRNLHHGPAMDQASHFAQSQYVLFLDSDAEVIKGGFIESMLSLAGQDLRSYAIGKRIYMNRRGFDVTESSGAIPYIRPILMLVRRELYLTLPRFRRHGSPCLENMKEASRRGLGLIDFPVEEYIVHHGRGTAGRHGYGLGVRGKLNYLLNKVGL